MTNSRLTDPEVLELRFPVLLEEFAIRRIRCHQPITVSTLSGHRRVRQTPLSVRRPYHA